MVKMLLDCGSKIHLNDYSYLFVAVLPLSYKNDSKEVNYQIVKLLIDKGGNINHLANNGTNVLHISGIFKMHYPLIELLLNKGANIEKYESFLDSAIFIQENSTESNYGINTAKLISSHIFRISTSRKTRCS